MPAPSLVSVPPVPVLRPLAEIVTLPVPPTVSACPVPVLVPLSVSVPESELMRVAPPSVMAPLKVLLPLMLRSAPSSAIPVPLSVRASVTVMPPCTCRAPPLATVVAAAVVPSAAAL